jgi:hypothetical protein
MQPLFTLEFRSFLERENLSYIEQNNCFSINSGSINVCLIPFAEYQNLNHSLKTHSASFILHQDQWISKREIVESHIKVSSGIYESYYARNSFVEKINISIARSFHNQNHLLGEVGAKYNYALIDKATSRILAVSSFSSPRVMDRGEGSVRSYEWIRHTTAIGVRVAGGMSKLLSKFVKDVSPQEVMTYCDSEWSRGDSYIALGFKKHSETGEQIFYIDKCTYERFSIKKIRREGLDLTPDNIQKQYYILRTKGNLKFLKSIV